MCILGGGSQPAPPPPQKPISPQRFQATTEQIIRDPNRKRSLVGSGEITENSLVNRTLLA